MSVAHLLLSLLATNLFAQDAPISGGDVFLTPTFGVLDKRDLAYGRKDIARHYGKDFRDNGATAWQCFDTRKIRIYCTSVEDSESESEGSDPELKVEVGRYSDTYMYRRGYGESYCRDQMWILRKILKNTPIARIAGSFVSQERQGEKVGRLWVFSRLKSPRGDYCVFPEDEWGCHSSW